MGISTRKSGTFDAFSRFLELRLPDGTPAFNVFQWRSICDNCLRRGRKSACEHERVNDPPWIEEDNDGFLQTVMSSEGHAREILGVGSTDAERKMFEHDDCARLANPELQLSRVAGTPRYFYTGIDPGGGRSEFAIVSIVVQANVAVVSHQAADQARTSASACGSRGSDETHCRHNAAVRPACAARASSVVCA